MPEFWQNAASHSHRWYFGGGKATFVIASEGDVNMLAGRCVRSSFAVLLMVLIGSVTAQAEPIASRLEDVYRMVGEGDTPHALELSASLLTQVHDTDPLRAEVLQARLDVLAKRTPFSVEDVQPLRDTVQIFAQHNPRGRSIALDLDIADAYMHGNTQVAVDLIQHALASPEKKSAVEIAWLHSFDARANAVLNDHLQQAHAAAQTARQAWHVLPGLRARLNECEMYYFSGATLAFSGSQADALRQFELGAALASKTFGADSLARTKIDAERARVLAGMGRHAESLRLHEDLLLASRHRFGEQSFEAAKAEGLVGADLQEIGDYAASREHYEHVDAMLVLLPDASAYDRGVIATNYGNLLQEMGDEDAALKHYHQALDTWGEDPQTTHVRAVVLANMGNTEFRLTHYDLAIADHQHALVLREQSDGKDSPGLAYALDGLGAATLVLKRYAESEQYYRRAIDLRGRGLAPNHPTLAPLNFGLALARWGQGDVAEAFRLATMTAQYQQTMLATFATDFSERQSVAYRDLLVPATALVVTLAAKRGDAESIASAWQLVMHERGLVARTEAYRLAAARVSSDVALAKAWDAWRVANTALADEWLEKTPGTERMALLRKQAESAERELWAHAGRDAPHSISAPMALADLGRALPADGILIAFTEGLVDTPSRFLATGAMQLPEDWYAFSLDPKGRAQLRRVGSVETLSAQARAWYGSLRDPHSDIAQLHHDGLSLRQQLLDPFMAIDGKRSVFIVPEGELFRVSFAALPGTKNGYLIEGGTRVHTLSHENDLATLPAAQTSVTTLLAGAPNFPPLDTSDPIASRATCLRAARQGFAAIPNAARELDNLQSLLSGSDPKAHIELMAGAAATKQNVFAALPKANIIHLATHGFSLDESCAEDTAARGVTLTHAVLKEPANTSTISALSGLAFSGAKLSEKESAVGVLSAGELGTLDLSHVDWIALSACDSGLGKITRNEGVFGMRRALRLAGARTVVMSLWQVDDASTADLMQVLYRARFVEHHDVPTSMANAMQSVLSARRTAGLSDHPYYWAAFIDEGGWR